MHIEQDDGYYYAEVMDTLDKPRMEDQMKKLFLLLLIGGLLTAMPALAAEHKMSNGHKMMSVEEHAQLCSVQSQTIDEKIKRLQAEIKKGKTNYSAEDLQKLEQKLKDANYLLDSITGP